MATVLIAAAASGCMPPAGAPVAPTADAPDVPTVPDLHVLTDDQASARGLTGDDLLFTFPEDESDGTAMLERWFARAQERGRTAIFPENVVEATYVPPTPRLQGVYKPVLRAVTHYEQRCRLVPPPARCRKRARCRRKCSRTNATGSR